MRRVGVIGLVVAAALTGCGGGDKQRPAAAAPAKPRAPAAKLEGSKPCPDAKGFTCSVLKVPLDHGGKAPGTLELHVAVADNADAPRGVLLDLTGGPGQGGVSFIPRVRARMRTLLRQYRLVMLDQRGTGDEALRCPALQKAMGTSDLTVPPPAAVTACARTLGDDRRFYSTADTVADLDDLRAALRADKLTIDGISYGTFVAERYAIAYPDRVNRLVLDSVVPAAGLDGLMVAGMNDVARVLRSVCRERTCRGDPVADLAAVVRARHNGPALYDTLVAMSVGAPSFSGVPEALREARQGRPQRLERLIRAVHVAQRAPAPVLSQGLHAATICADLRPPWGDANAPLAGREEAVRRAAAKVDPTPFDRATVIGNGVIQTCLPWPPTPAPEPPKSPDLPPVPTLLLSGERDLSTPRPWVDEQLRHTPRGRLVVIPGAGHSPQSRSPGNAGRRAVESFLLRGSA